MKSYSRQSRKFPKISEPYVAISTLESVPLAETERLLEELASRGLKSDILLFNKAVSAAPSLEQWQEELLGAANLDELSQAQALDQAKSQSQTDALSVAGELIQSAQQIKLPYSPFRRSPAAQILFLARSLAQAHS